MSLASLGLQSVDFVTLAPPLLIVGFALVALVVDLLLPAGEQFRVVHERLVWAISIAGVLAALGWAAALAAGHTRLTFCSRAGCFYVADDFTAYLQILILASIAIVLLLVRSSLHHDRLPPGEFCFLLLLSVSGMLLLPASRDLITLLIGLELVSLPAFVLVGLRRSDPRSGEAALTYFVFSIVATALTIYGIALLYGVTGGLTVDQVSSGLRAVVAQHGQQAPLAAAATVLVTVGFSFKIAAVPFHAWVPDTYQGAPLPVAAALSTASKTAGFAGLIVLLFYFLLPEAQVWGPVVAALAVASMTVGNVVALRQWHAVRLLAWSTVAQAGYLLVPLAVTPTLAHPGAQVPATLAYLGIYAAMNLGAFATLAAVSRWAPRLAINDLRGLARRSPVLAGLVALFFTALAGLPPGVAGLVAKVVVLRAAVEGGLTWLAVIAAINTVIGLAYYLRMAAQPFLSPADAETTSDAAVVGASMPTGLVAALATAGALVVALSVDPQPLLHAASSVGF